MQNNTPDITHHAIYKHVQALICVRAAAAIFIDGLYPEDYSPEEKTLAEMLANPALQDEPKLIEAITGMIRLFIPGVDLYAAGVGVSSLAANDGKSENAIAVTLQLFPGKNVSLIMTRLMISADSIVAHNIKFDAFMMQIEHIRAEIPMNFPIEQLCTVEMSKDILQIPPTAKMLACGFTGYKNPNLGEAYEHFTGKKLDGAHDAMVDVRACKAVFFEILKSRMKG